MEQRLIAVVLRLGRLGRRAHGHALEADQSLFVGREDRHRVAVVFSRRAYRLEKDHFLGGIAVERRRLARFQLGAFRHEVLDIRRRRQAPLEAAVVDVVIRDDRQGAQGFKFAGRLDELHGVGLRAFADAPAFRVGEAHFAAIGLGVVL